MMLTALPPLGGSPRQVSWAQQLRADHLPGALRRIEAARARLESWLAEQFAAVRAQVPPALVRYLEVDPEALRELARGIERAGVDLDADAIRTMADQLAALRRLPAWLAAQTSAGWWIDNREALTRPAHDYPGRIDVEQGLIDAAVRGGLALDAPDEDPVVLAADAAWPVVIEERAVGDVARVRYRYQGVEATADLPARTVDARRALARHLGLTAGYSQAERVAYAESLAAAIVGEVDDAGEARVWARGHAVRVYVGPERGPWGHIEIHADGALRMQWQRRQAVMKRAAAVAARMPIA